MNILPNGTPVFQVLDKHEVGPTVIPGVITGHRVEKGPTHPDYVVYTGEFTEADGGRYRDGFMVEVHTDAKKALDAHIAFSNWMSSWVKDNPASNYPPYP